MNAYICDSCGKIMKNPYEVRMREFFAGCHFDFGFTVKDNVETEKTVHLCDKCWKNLSILFDKTEE